MAFRSLFKALWGCFNLCVVILRLTLFVYKKGAVLEPTANIMQYLKNSQR